VLEKDLTVCKGGQGRRWEGPTRMGGRCSLLHGKAGAGGRAEGRGKKSGRLFFVWGRMRFSFAVFVGARAGSVGRCVGRRRLGAGWAPGGETDHFFRLC